MSKIDDRWPWALIEAAFQAGWHASGDIFEVDVLLHMLTGYETEVSADPNAMCEFRRLGSGSKLADLQM